MDDALFRYFPDLSGLPLRAWFALALEPRHLAPIAAAAIMGLLKARLLLFTLALTVGISAWLMVTGRTVAALPAELIIGLALVSMLGVFESIVLLVGGRSAGGQFWGTLFVGLLVLLLLAPFRLLRRGAGLLRLLRRLGPKI